jgi:hypothetical protein
MPFDLIPLAILLAIAPGYVAIYFATLGRTGRALTPDLQFVLQSLVVSAAILAAVGPFAFADLWPHRNDLQDYAWSVAAWLVGIVVMLPYVAGRAVRGAGQLVDRHREAWWARVVRFAVPGSPPPTIWDWAVTTNTMEDRFLVIEYRDGHRIAGAHGTPGVSISSPEEHGIFLAVEWTCDESGLIDRVQNSGGVLVPITDEIRCIHLYQPGQGGPHEDRDQDRSSGRGEGSHAAQEPASQGPTASAGTATAAKE